MTTEQIVAKLREERERLLALEEKAHGEAVMYSNSASFLLRLINEIDPEEAEPS